MPGGMIHYLDHKVYIIYLIGSCSRRGEPQYRGCGTFWHLGKNAPPCGPARTNPIIEAPLRIRDSEARSLND